MDAEVIKKRIVNLEKRQQEIKDTQGIIKSEIECDPEYQQATEERKAINEKIADIKLRMSEKFAGELEELRENKEEVSVLKEILDAELQEYSKETGRMQIETDNGLRNIVINAKAVKTNQPSLFA